MRARRCLEQSPAYPADGPAECAERFRATLANRGLATRISVSKTPTSTRQNSSATTAHATSCPIRPHVLRDAAAMRDASELLFAMCAYRDNPRD
jgi:hypothetical protein